jgi:predicted Zn-dependent protease
MNQDSKSELKKVADKILSLSSADETEILLFKTKSALTRYAENYIHQNVSDHSVHLHIRTVIGKKTATASTNSFSNDAIKQTLENAISATKLQKDNPKLLPLPKPQEYKTVDNYSLSTDKTTPERRANEIAKAVNLCKKHKLEGAGIFSTETSEIAIANSNGLFGYDSSTQAEFSITAMKDTASGWNEVIRKNIDDIDVEKSTQIAIEKVEKSQYPLGLKPGKYTVIMEPAAVAEFILFLLWKGFNGMDYIEGTSFLKDSLNKKVFSEKFSILENPYNPKIGGTPFDFEGMPVQKLTLVENGMPKHFATNRWIAKETGRKNNGHAIPLPSQGAYPFAMCIKPGTSSINKMIKSTNYGVLVTHFHYSNLIDPMTLLATGMTRDGLFLIEDGKITKPLKNMRYTESVINIFSNIEEIGKETALCNAFFGGGFLVPAMKINNFNFSSSTEF